jgi:hypothetical protein
VPSSNYRGADFQGTKGIRTTHPEFGKANASLNRDGLPVCATGINVDVDADNFGNDYFSFCEYPMISSAMALPINGMYTNRSYTWWGNNGTVTAGPPKDLMGSPDPGKRDSRPRDPGYPAPELTDPNFDGIAGAANTLLLCDGVFAHCTAGSHDGCAYGHGETFLRSLDKNKDHADGVLGNVPWLYKDDDSSLPTFASLVCIRNPWASGEGYTGGSKGEGYTFQAACQSAKENSGASLFPPSSSTTGQIKTNCLKGGGWGWPYCPAQTPTSKLKGGDADAGTTSFCVIKPQGGMGGSFYYFGCMSIRLFPVSCAVCCGWHLLLFFCF